MKEIHCKKCNRLLFVIRENGKVEDIILKCSKCGHYNLIKEVKYSPKYETREIA